MSDRKSSRLIFPGLVVVTLIAASAVYFLRPSDSVASPALEKAQSSNKLQSLAELDDKAPTNRKLDVQTWNTAEGAKVHVQPYARRRFDGLRADTPEVVTEKTSDGTPYTITRHILGKAPAKLPIPEPQCMELGQLIEQLEEMPVPDGFRCITHMLVDAGARDFAWVDPKPSKIIETPPAISFTVSTTKFEGQVTILYDRGGDTYVVELHRDGELIDRHDEVYFDMLGEVLERLIDDGRWRLIGVSVIDAKASRQRQAVPA